MVNIKLKEMRKRKKVTQEELSRRSGISKQAIIKIESGESIPRVDTLIKLCDALSVNMFDMIGRH